MSGRKILDPTTYMGKPCSLLESERIPRVVLLKYINILPVTVVKPQFLVRPTDSVFSVSTEISELSKLIN